MINGAIMNIKQLSLAAAVSALTFTTATNAVLGPIPIYLNTEYRTSNPVIGSISSTIIITSDDIASSGANTFNELLKSIAGINFQQPQGNTPSLLLRGLKSKYTKIIIDGIELPSSFDAPLTDVIALNNIDRVEIIKGSASSLYGSGAIAGIIQVFTKTGAISDVSVNFSSDNTKHIKYSYGSIDENSSINIGLSHYKTDGIDATGDGDLDGSEKKSGHFKFKYKDTEFSLIDSKYDYDYDHGNAIIDFTQEQVKHTIQFDNIASTLSYAQSENGYAFDGGTPSIFNIANVSLLNEMKLDNALLNIGISRDAKSTSAKELIEAGIYTQYQEKINGNDVVIGLRHNRNSKFDNVTTYNFGIGKSIDNKRFTFNYATAYKAPSLSQLYGSHGSSVLTAEDAINIEIGIVNQYKWGLVNANIHKNTINNAISYTADACSDESPINWPAPNYDATCATGTLISGFYSNIDKINTKGFDLTINTKISGWNADITYDYIKSIEGDNNIQSIRIPKHTYSLKLAKSYNGFNNKVSIIYKSESNDNAVYPASGTEILPGYTLLNFGTSYNYNSDAKVSLKVNNALDKDYTVANGYNQLGRVINLGITYKF